MIKNIKEFEKELKDLLEKYGVCLAVDIQGDTHGISENFVVEDRNNNSHVLSHFSSYLYPNDLCQNDD